MHKKDKQKMIKNLQQWALMVFFVGYVFIPLNTWLKTESAHVYAAPEVVEVQQDHEISPPPKVELSEREQIIEYIEEVFEEHLVIALAVAQCESGLRPSAFNDNTTWGGVGRDHGIFQINDVYHANKGDIPNLTWKQNIRIARKIFDASGWYAWSCYKNGNYLVFLEI